ncbi:MAG: hypothetical protein U9R73_00615 [Pseudomonadota bacterium]|nr:hypothetical protein [Pseudomonadota bacterium]
MARRSNHWKRWKHVPVAWSPEEIERLRDMRAVNLDTWQMAQLMPGRTAAQLVQKLHEMGLGRSEPIRA